MKLIVIFLVAATAVVALAVIALKDDPAPLPGASGAIPQPARETATTPPKRDVFPGIVMAETDADKAPEPQQEIMGNADLMALIREYGFEKLEGQWREWAMARGYPALDASGGYLYDQPYEQYDTDTLLALAANGDMWAQQIVANRLAKTDPAEAIELYRQAAIRGSVYAMSEMSSLYARIADKRREVEFKSDELALEQVYAMRDAPVPPEVAGYAWTAVAEMAGTEPMLGNVASSQLARKLSDEQKEEACAMARGMYDELVSARKTLGLGDFDRSPPPLVYWNPGLSSECANVERPEMDLTGCREVNVEGGGETNTVWLCAD